MKIALSTFQGRMSPVFDWSSRLLVVDADHGREIHRMERDLANMPPRARACCLVDLGVDTLLCGGISRFMLALVEAQGIRVIPWIAGEAEEVIRAFLDKRIPGEEFYMPGCCRMGRGPKRRLRRGKGPGRAPGRGKDRS